MCVSNDSIPIGPPFAHWSLHSRRIGADWLITAECGKCTLHGEGETRAEAWRRLGEQINRVGLPPPSSTNLMRFRREWREPVLACVGALLGWFAPLLLKQSIPGAGVALCECAEDVLYPLLAFVGGGIGITCGGVWAAIRQRGALSRP